MKNKHHHKNEDSFLKPITMEEATALTCGKIIYSFREVKNEQEHVIGKSIMFYERDKPEELADKWSLHLYDDGRMMIKKW